MDTSDSIQTMVEMYRNAERHIKKHVIMCRSLLSGPESQIELYL